MKPGPLARRCLRLLVALAALAFAVQAYFGVAGVPGPAVAWMTGQDLQSDEPPRYVVVLGGGGIPSASGLIRTYHAAEIGLRETNATIIVSLPSDGDPLTNSVGRMRDELVLRGVSPGRIRMEHAALNTHEQAVNIRRMVGEESLGERVLLVTSPTHVRRAYLCFRREGFRNLGVRAAHGTGAEADPGSGILLRYGLWSNLELQVEIARELAALLWYRAKGWI
jgi:uncharacterized SAM-binding protein YcdF (DUF218 family)